MNKISKMMRVHEKFDKEILDIASKRLLKGTEKNPRKPKGTAPRLTLAMIRHPLFKKIKEEIILSELREEKLLK